MIHFRRIWVGLRIQCQRIILSHHSPHAVAAGVSLGIFIAMLPLYGVQMVLSALLATLFRFNRPAAVLTVWVSNPMTIPFLLWISYEVGTFSMTLSFDPSPETARRFKVVGAVIEQFKWAHFFSWMGDVARALFGLGTNVLVPTLVGCLMMGVISASATYPVCYWLVNRYRKLRERRARARLAAAATCPQRTRSPKAK